MKWYTCIIENPNHVQSVQYFHTRAENPIQAEEHALKWVFDGDPTCENTEKRDCVYVPFVFEDRIFPCHMESVTRDEHPKRDWRIGLSCKPKYRTDPRYYERGEIIDVHPSGTGGVFDVTGVLRIRLTHKNEVILQRADDWVSA